MISVIETAAPEAKINKKIKLHISSYATHVFGVHHVLMTMPYQNVLHAILVW
jgi:hypothetical protein